MNDSKASLVVEMDYEDAVTMASPPPVIPSPVQEPVPDPINLDPPAVPDPKPDPVPPVSDPIIGQGFKGSPAAAFSMALQTLDPFAELKVDENAKIEDVLPAISETWSKTLQKAEQKIAEQYKGIADEIALYRVGRPDMISELQPLKQIAMLPIMASEQLPEENASENRKQLILSYYTQVKGNTEQEAEILYNTVKESGKDLDFAKVAATEFGKIYVGSIQNIQKQESDRLRQEQEHEQEVQKNINTTIKGLLQNKKILGLALTDADALELNAAIYDDKNPVSYKMLGDDGKEIELTGTKAAQFFAEFDQNIELQLYFMHRWLKGDFNKVVVKDQRQHQIASEVARVLNQSVDTQADDKNKMYI